MTKNKRFTQKDEDDWEILDRNNHFAYAHSGYQAEKIIQELNELVETNRELYKENKELKSKIKDLKFENEKYRDMFFEIVETTLTDKNCRELYCKGLLDIFDKANSLNQARDMVKEHLK